MSWINQLREGERKICLDCLFGSVKTFGLRRGPYIECNLVKWGMMTQAQRNKRLEELNCVDNKPQSYGSSS